MTPQNEALNIVLDLIEKDKHYKVISGALHRDGGISAEITRAEA